MPSQGVVAAPVNHPPGWGSGNLKTWKAEICLYSWRASLGRCISVITELGGGGSGTHLVFQVFRNSIPHPHRLAAMVPSPSGPAVWRSGGRRTRFQQAPHSC